MPKRSSPFPETFSSQYKIHIGQPEISKLGVCGDKYRQEMFEKTQNLLFVGAKAVMENLWRGEETPAGGGGAGGGAAAGAAWESRLLRGQTTIGHDGRLRRGGATTGSPPAPPGCCVCHRILGPGSGSGSGSVCSLCDRLCCSSCSRRCSHCSCTCCSVCSTIDYSGRYEEVLCCSCST